MNSFTFEIKVRHQATPMGYLTPEEMVEIMEGRSSAWEVLLDRLPRAAPEACRVTLPPACPGGIAITPDIVPSLSETAQRVAKIHQARLNQLVREQQEEIRRTYSCGTQSTEKMKSSILPLLEKDARRLFWLGGESIGPANESL